MAKAGVNGSSDLRSQVTNHLWIHRKKMGYSQKYIASLLGHKSASHISDYERGKYLPSLETALKLEIILCAPVAFLFRDIHLQLKEDVRRQREALESHHHEQHPS